MEGSKPRTYFVQWTQLTAEPLHQRTTRHQPLFRTAPASFQNTSREADYVFWLDRTTTILGRAWSCFHRGENASTQSTEPPLPQNKGINTSDACPRHCISYRRGRSPWTPISRLTQKHSLLPAAAAKAVESPLLLCRTIYTVHGYLCYKITRTVSTRPTDRPSRLPSTTVSCSAQLLPAQLVSPILDPPPPPLISLFVPLITYLVELDGGDG